ncbi:hypothetical protein HHI36_007662 [Cryptolaemus montrouzieri]|uniref:Uncharacterized protein n=1 Tax=Cryptolaemus montrouzieri TaxID=559131 RepID=A0ABD2MQ71_9CUCU
MHIDWYAVQAKNASTVNQQLAFLEQSPYEPIDAKDLEIAKDMMEQEMEYVKRGMNYGDLPLGAYSQVWEECLGQVLFLPNQHRYTRANLATQNLIKHLKELYEQADQANLELNTFKFLQEQERVAAPKRIQGLTEDVNRQTEREKSLQQKYSILQEQINEIQEAHAQQIPTTAICGGDC